MKKRNSFRPWKQGDLDTFCGQTSICTALRLCAGVKVLGQRQSEELYAAIAEHLLVSGHLRSIIRGGIHDSQYWFALRFAINFMARRHGIQIKASRPFLRKNDLSLRNLVADLRVFLSEPRRAAVISYQTFDHAHYTVVRDLSARSLFLADSSDRSMLHLKACTVGEREPSKAYRYVIAVPSTVFVSMIEG
tara:strand:+ start:597 stop:1169 length:573 start_codon:yes stop_codon:yes gene_type:complete